LLGNAIQALNQKRNSQFWRNLNLKCVHLFITAGIVVSANALINNDSAKVSSEKPITRLGQAFLDIFLDCYLEQGFVAQPEPRNIKETLALISLTFFA